MFNLQGSEVVIILLLALVVLGPEKLPDAMRRAGQFFAELKKMSAGFQSEFRAAVDEPMREIRDTANTLRDSADFTKLQTGVRDEKPKSAEMAPADPTAVPSSEIPTFDEAGGEAASSGPEPTADSKPAPFSGESSAAPRPPRDKPRSEPIVPPPPFASMSAPAPDLEADADADADVDADVGTDGEVARPSGEEGADDATPGRDGAIAGAEAPTTVDVDEQPSA